MSKVNSFSLFFLSFSPLWLSVLIIDIKSIIENKQHIITEQCGIAAIVFFFIVSSIKILLAFRKNKNDTTIEYTIDDAEEEKAITSEYLLSYILPLFAFDFTVWHNALIFLLFFSILAFLCIRHQHFSINIILELCGYRFYRCSLKAGNKTLSKVVITKEQLQIRRKETIEIYPFNNEYVQDVKNWGEE